ASARRGQDTSRTVGCGHVGLTPRRSPRAGEFSKSACDFVADFAREIRTMGTGRMELESNNVVEQLGGKRRAIQWEITWGTAALTVKQV
ncbi:MAG: hypothetical protein L0Y71_19535, partial [Gemmataceae bacterium]|nr:hypothetical protein [Gemmataceae bacterium]